MSIEVEWARMTAPDLREIAAREGALAILPAGSLEQHGPHLPVITDTASASAASIAAARLVAEGGSGAGRRAARPVAGLERASSAVRRHDQRRLCRLSRDPRKHRAIAARDRLCAPADRQRPWRQYRSAGGGVARTGGGI